LSQEIYFLADENYGARSQMTCVYTVADALGRSLTDVLHSFFKLALAVVEKNFTKINSCLTWKNFFSISDLVW
jgi:hypothetical protein